MKTRILVVGVMSHHEKVLLIRSNGLKIGTTHSGRTGDAFP
jgi:hypothetical protein